MNFFAFVEWRGQRASMVPRMAASTLYTLLFQVDFETCKFLTFNLLLLPF